MQYTAVTPAAEDICKKPNVMLNQYVLVVKHSRQTDSIPKTVIAGIRIALFRVPIVWWRKPYGGLYGHGTSPMGRCEGSPESSEVSSPGKLSVFSKSSIGTLETSFITVLGILPDRHLLNLKSCIKKPKIIYPPTDLRHGEQECILLL
jgi:hypothetical protein